MFLHRSRRCMIPELVRIIWHERKNQSPWWTSSLSAILKYFILTEDISTYVFIVNKLCASFHLYERCDFNASWIAYWITDLWSENICIYHVLCQDRDGGVPYGIEPGLIELIFELNIARKEKQSLTLIPNIVSFDKILIKRHILRIECHSMKNWLIVQIPSHISKRN